MKVRKCASAEKGPERWCASVPKTAEHSTSTIARFGHWGFHFLSRKNRRKAQAPTSIGGQVACGSGDSTSASTKPMKVPRALLVHLEGHA